MINKHLSIHFESIHINTFKEQRTVMFRKRQKHTRGETFIKQSNHKLFIKEDETIRTELGKTTIIIRLPI